MALYTHELVISLSATEILSVTTLNIDGSNLVNLNVLDFAQYVTFVSPDTIDFNVNITDLFTLYPLVAYISYNTPAGATMGSSSVADTEHIFRNTTELDAFNAGTLLTTDFSPPPIPQTVDLTPLLNKMDEILTNQQLQSQNMNNISSELFGITTSLSDFSQTLDVFQTSLDSLSQSVSFLPNTSSVTDLHNDLAVKLNLVHALNNDIFDKLGTFDLSELNNLHEDVIALGNQLSMVTVPLQSLNGKGCEYIDGDTLIVVGRDYPMTVTRSFYTLVADNSYTVVYDLLSVDGHSVSAPEAFVSEYVELITTP